MSQIFDILVMFVKMTLATWLQTLVCNWQNMYGDVSPIYCRQMLHLLILWAGSIERLFNRLCLDQQLWFQLLSLSIS